jgi:signal peptidase I
LDVAVATAPARRKRRWNPVLEWVVVIVVALGAAFVVRSFVFQQYVINGPSMRPTLQPGDRVLLNKLSYRAHDVNRGDVVVFDRVQGTRHDDLIKRVIALEGETIRIENCAVFIDGEELVEPYLADEVQAGRCGATSMAPLTVPDGQVFVMGDNRPESSDSRAFGPIDVDEIRGRAFVVLWPAGNMRWL